MLWVSVILSTVVGNSAVITHAQAGSVPTLNRWIKHCIPDHGCFHHTSFRLWDVHFPNTKFQTFWPGRPGSWGACSVYLSSSLKWFYLKTYYILPSTCQTQVFSYCRFLHLVICFILLSFFPPHDDMTKALNFFEHQFSVFAN